MACTLDTACTFDRSIGLDQVEVSIAPDNRARGKKAMAWPAFRRIEIDSRFWDKIPSVDGRLAILCHELAHVQGARCESCADVRAGELMRELGATTPRDGALGMLRTIEHRDNVQAAQDVVQGFGADGTREVVVAGRTIDLVEVAPNAWVAQPYAASWQAAVAEATQAGIRVGYSSTFRTYEEQDRLYQAFKAGTGNPADPPGSLKHGHELGTAVDAAFDTGEAREAFAAIAARHGWTRPVAGEPWHFEPGRPGTGLGLLALAAVAAAALA